MKFKIGDIVIVKSGKYVGHIKPIEYCTKSMDRNYYGIFNIERIGDLMFFREDEIDFADPEFLKERDRKREELRLKYIDIDPYGEEIWEN